MGERPFINEQIEQDLSGARQHMALSVSTPIHDCHAWNRGYCGHGFEAAKLGDEDSL